MKPRNVVLFLAESWDGRKLGLTGHPALKEATPNITRLAGAGAWFEQAYTSHPISCPARANLWSGRYTHELESWNNFKGLQPGMWALLDDLPKTHTLCSLGKLDYMAGGHTLFARVGAWLAPVGLPKSSHRQLPQIQDPVVEPDRNPRCHEKDWQLIDQAQAFLRAQAGAEKPFFLNLSTGLVHTPFRTNAYWLDKIPADAVDLPPPDPTTHPARLYQRLAKGWQHAGNEAAIRLVRRIYYAMCAEADAMIGALYDTLRELDLLDSTYFVFAADHGEQAGEHGEWAKQSMYEASVRIPLILAGPGIAPGARIPDLVSLVDLCPTFLEMTGQPPRPGLAGQSLLPSAAGHARPGRDAVYASFTGMTLNTSAYMLRRDHWKYVVYMGFPAQLFDLEQDPDELHDLRAEHPEVAAALDAELRALADYEQTHRDLVRYNKEAFREWRRQARRGLYWDDTYSLAEHPSSDYWDIMRNTFEGYDEADEACVDAWLADER